jgi:hypothetical protein
MRLHHNGQDLARVKRPKSRGLEIEYLKPNPYEADPAQTGRQRLERTVYLL